MRKRFVLIALMALLMQTPQVFAETEVEAYGLGPAAPQPQKTRTEAGLYTLRARVVNAATGDLADVALPGGKLRLELAFTAEPGAADRPLHLRCRVQFKDAQGVSSEFKKTAPCFSGTLWQGAGVFVALDMGLSFKPDRNDPAGTSGVLVGIDDLDTGAHYLLVPTYEWRGGQS